MVKITLKERQAIVDEFGELDRQMSEAKPVTDRHKALKEQIASWYDDEPKDKDFVAEGKLYTVPVSARKKERKIIDMGRLLARLGKAKFMDFCTFPLAMVDKLLGDDEKKGLVREDRSGNRTVGKAVAKRAAVLQMPTRKAA